MIAYVDPFKRDEPALLVPNSVRAWYLDTVWSTEAGGDFKCRINPLWAHARVSEY